MTFTDSELEEMQAVCAAKAKARRRLGAAHDLGHAGREEAVAFGKASEDFDRLLDEDTVAKLLEMAQGETPYEQYMELCGELVKAEQRADALTSWLRNLAGVAVADGAPIESLKAWAEREIELSKSRDLRAKQNHHQALRCREAEQRAEQAETLLRDLRDWLWAAGKAEEKTGAASATWLAAFADTWVPRIEKVVGE